MRWRAREPAYEIASAFVGIFADGGGGLAMLTVRQG
jgi:hypothetical protein